MRLTYLPRQCYRPVTPAVGPRIGLLSIPSATGRGADFDAKDVAGIHLTLGTTKSIAQLRSHSVGLLDAHRCPTHDGISSWQSVKVSKGRDALTLSGRSRRYSHGY